MHAAKETRLARNASAQSLANTKWATKYPEKEKVKAQNAALGFREFIQRK